MKFPKEVQNLIKEKLIEYPDLPSRTLAKIIYAMNPQIFLSMESVRSCIRYYRGKTGDSRRKVVKKTYGEYF